MGESLGGAAGQSVAWWLESDSCLGPKDELLGFMEGSCGQGPRVCLSQLWSPGRVPPAELSSPIPGSEEVDSGIGGWLVGIQEEPPKLRILISSFWGSHPALPIPAVHPCLWRGWTFMVRSMDTGARPLGSNPSSPTY